MGDVGGEQTDHRSERTRVEKRWRKNPRCEDSRGEFRFERL